MSYHKVTFVFESEEIACAAVLMVGNTKACLLSDIQPLTALETLLAKELDGKDKPAMCPVCKQDCKWCVHGNPDEVPNES